MKINKKLKPIYFLAAYKVLQGITELIGAYFLLTLSYSQIHAIALRLTREELVRDPRDQLVFLLFKYLPFVADYQERAGVIILLIGVYDLVTGIGLFYEKSWARNIILWVMVLSLPYNFFKLFQKFDIANLILIGLQLVFIYILWKHQPKARVAVPKN